MADVDTGIRLKAQQCAEIGRHALLSPGFYYQAMDWFSIAIQKLTAEGNTILVAELEEDLEIATAAVSDLKCISHRVTHVMAATIVNSV